MPKVITILPEDEPSLEPLTKHIVMLRAFAEMLLGTKTLFDTEMTETMLLSEQELGRRRAAGQREAREAQQRTTSDLGGVQVLDL